MEKIKIACASLFLLGLVASITVCAIHFGRPAILCWNIMPALLAVGVF